QGKAGTASTPLPPERSSLTSKVYTPKRQTAASVRASSTAQQLTVPQADGSPATLLHPAAGPKPSPADHHTLPAAWYSFTATLCQTKSGQLPSNYTPTKTKQQILKPFAAPTRTIIWCQLPRLIAAAAGWQMRGTSCCQAERTATQVLAYCCRAPAAKHIPVMQTEAAQLPRTIYFEPQHCIAAEGDITCCVPWLTAMQHNS
ncbi:hypothetical protein COO60DRAFT_1583635, partial [Scenedesmus sp. NREL 46B-D3]